MPHPFITLGLWTNKVLCLYSSASLPDKVIAILPDLAQMPPLSSLYCLLLTLRQLVVLFPIFPHNHFTWHTCRYLLAWLFPPLHCSPLRKGAMFCSSLYPQSLVQFLTRGKGSVNIWVINYLLSPYHVPDTAKVLGIQNGWGDRQTVSLYGA